MNITFPFIDRLILPMPWLVQAPHGLWKITVSRQRPAEENPQDPTLSQDNREETGSSFVCFPTLKKVVLYDFCFSLLLHLKLTLFSGLSHMPRSDKSEIVFQLSNPESYKKYVETMKDFLDLYDDEKQTSEQKFDDCGGGEYELIVIFSPHLLPTHN